MLNIFSYFFQVIVFQPWKTLTCLKLCKRKSAQSITIHTNTITGMHIIVIVNIIVNVEKNDSVVIDN
jgi:hypothetical protein